MTRPISSQDIYTSQELELSYGNCNKLIDFMIKFRGPNNDNSGKYSTPLKTLHTLFDSTWTRISISSGHVKLQHSITKIVINYQNHDNDPVDPGAVVTIAEAIQQHINTFYNDYLGYSTWVRHKRKPDFNAIAKRLNSKTPAN